MNVAPAVTNGITSKKERLNMERDKSSVYDTRHHRISEISLMMFKSS